MLVYLGNNSTNGRVLNNAEDVCRNRKINGGDTLTFKLPLTEFENISVCDRVMCEKEVYVIENLSRDNDSKEINISCTHEFIYTAQHLHIPSFASTDEVDYIGVEIPDVLEGLDGKLKGTMGSYGYRLLTSSECELLGYTPLGGMIDYESEDKVTMWSVLENIISFAGRGEILYSSNINGEKCWGMVEKLGRETSITLSDTVNMNNVSVEYDISDMITMLWPYGDDDMDITSAPQNKDGTAYIISPNAEVYGKICGSKSYSISNATNAGPERLFERAVWEFDIANPDRIDVPSVNISGNVADIGISEGIMLGDTVSVIDNGKILRERIISLKEYPYSGQAAEVSIGRVKRDMFFYLSQIGAFTQRYKDISAQNGKIYGSKVTGTFKGNVEAAEESSRLINPTGQILIDANGIRILSQDGAFFYVNKNKLEIADVIAVENGEAAASLSKLNLNGFAFMTDDEGNLYFNGKKIQLITEVADSGN